ncbi:YcxB family protein [Desulfitobacterium sp. Sab5]|uniref:YcxB family protein n=1 Tax=Desulfitobacterium nosdiversum TaxID=3375356 RepID=UPI003CEF0F25
MEEINSDKELNLNVSLEANDLKTYYYWIEKNNFFKRPTSVIVLVLVIMSIVRIIMSLVQGRIYNVYANNLIVLVGILFLLSRGIWRFIYINKITKKIFDSDKIIQKEQIFKITFTTITINYGESISKITWDEIYRIRETEKQFLIFIAINKPIVIPKRFFENPEDISLLRDFSKNVLPK